jgi:dickkopf
MPSDHSNFHRGEIEETIIESFGNDPSTLDGYSRRTTLSSKMYHTKGRLKSLKSHSSLIAHWRCLLNCFNGMLQG